MHSRPLYLKVIACEIIQRELCLLTANCPNIIDLEFLAVGNHDFPQKGNKTLQEAIDSVPADSYDAILIGYGVCNCIINGITATHTRLVIPRAHDCLTFLLGSMQRYENVFFQNPGAFYFSTGWAEFTLRRELREKGVRGIENSHLDELIQPNISPRRSIDELSAKYGPETAQYLVEISRKLTENYKTGIYIVIDGINSPELEKQARSICDKRGWKFIELNGDLTLLKKWLWGEWPEDEFLIVKPGQKVYASFKNTLIETNQK